MLIALVLLAAATQPARASAACASDDKVHAAVGPAITQHVAAAIVMLDQTARVRDVTQMMLPCGFSIYTGFTFNLVLQKGDERRLYQENNAFGFAPPGGFMEKPRPFDLSWIPFYKPGARPDPCADTARRHARTFEACSSFGNATAFFAVSANGGKHLLAHYVVVGDTLKQDFVVAILSHPVASLAFIPYPDAPGGTVTLMLREKRIFYRAFIDVTKG